MNKKKDMTLFKFIRIYILTNITRLIPSKVYLKYRVKNKTGKSVNFKNPITFTDKINYLKLYPDNELIFQYSDKLRIKQLTKKYVKSPKTLWIGKKITADIIREMPEKFVIKSNASSGDVHIVENKNNLNLKEINRHFSKITKINYYLRDRETSYKKINKTLFIEEYLNGASLIDYKFYCFNGEVKFCHIVMDRSTDLKDIMVDNEFKNLGFTLDKRTFNPELNIKKPSNFDKMINISESIAKDFKFVRVDLYNHEGEIFIGECTFYPWAGLYNVLPKEKEKFYENLLGSWIKL